MFQIPANECCFAQALMVVDLANSQTTRVCGDSHEPILVRSNQVVLYVKGANSTNSFEYDLTLQGISFTTRF